MFRFCSTEIELRMCVRRILLSLNTQNAFATGAPLNSLGKVEGTREERDKRGGKERNGKRRGENIPRNKLLGTTLCGWAEAGMVTFS